MASPAQNPTTTLVFSYGEEFSFLDRKDDKSVGLVPNYCPTFNAVTEFGTGGINMVAAPGEKAYGVLQRVPTREIETRDKYSTQSGVDKISVCVLSLKDSRLVSAVAYVSEPFFNLESSDRKPVDLRPPQKTYSKLIKELTDAGLNSDQLRPLEKAYRKSKMPPNWADRSLLGAIEKLKEETSEEELEEEAKAAIARSGFTADQLLKLSSVNDLFHNNIYNCMSGVWELRLKSACSEETSGLLDPVQHFSHLEPANPCVSCYPPVWHKEEMGETKYLDALELLPKDKSR